MPMGHSWVHEGSQSFRPRLARGAGAGLPAPRNNNQSRGKHAMTTSSRRFIPGGIAAALLVLPGFAAAQEFGYRGEIGPDNWSSLNPDWAACSNGEIQSPVDLGAQRIHPRLNASYGASTGRIFNNGHTVEVEIDTGNNTLVLDGVAYELVQFHFHTGSEHRVNGRGYDMELHLVHKSAAGTNAVIGVFLRRGPDSGALGPILAELPGIEGENVKYEIEDAFDPGDFLPASTAHYRYVGSLTTPPCTEGVQWIVMTEPVYVSDEDLAQFAAQVSFNARYTQRNVPARPARP
jgi:carbonic anhydrase